MKKKSNILKTAGLLELTGPFSTDDTSAKKTFAAEKRFKS